MTGYDSQIEPMFEAPDGEDPSPHQAKAAKSGITDVTYYGDSASRPLAEALLPRIERMLGSIA